MTEQGVTFLNSLRKGGDTETDFLREAVRQFVQELMDEEVTALSGAEPYERSEERATQRNGVRHRQWDTRVGTVDLAIPRSR
jgi:transposase-like protein